MGCLGRADEAGMLAVRREDAESMVAVFKSAVVTQQEAASPADSPEGVCERIKGRN